MARVLIASILLAVFGGIALACSKAASPAPPAPAVDEPLSCRCSVVAKDGEEYVFGCGAHACYSSGDKLFGVHCTFGGLMDDPSACDGVLPDGGDAADARPETEAAPAAATFDPPPSSRPSGFSAPLCLRLASATPGATIHYTLDGSTPTSASTVYDKPFQSTALTVRTLTVAAGFARGTYSDATYEFAFKGRPPTMPFRVSPETTTGTAPMKLHLTGVDTGEGTPAALCYSIDGSQPDCVNRNCNRDACGNPPPECAGLTPTCAAPAVTYDDDAGVVLADAGSIPLNVVACYANDGQNGHWILTYDVSAP